MTRLLCCSIVMATIVCVFTGCGEKLARVEGIVTFNGEPVSRGLINLEPVDGKGTVSGTSVEDGKFVIDDVVPGEKIVRISAVYSKGMRKNAEDGSEIEICEDLLPAEYGLTSKLRLMVELPSTKAEYKIEGPDPRKK